MKRFFCLLLSALLIASLAACAGQDQEEERIERVVTRMFTCPDEGLVSLIMDNPIYIDGSVQPDEDLLLKRQQAEEQYAEYLKTVFTAEDMPEDYQQQFCGRIYAALTFPSACVGMEMSIAVESVTVELISEDNRRYGYSAELVITDQNGEKTPYTQEGKVQLSEDGRVSWIDIKPLLELSDIIVRISNGMV